MGAEGFNEMEKDAIGEIMNISLGASATAVSTMLGAKVKITTPTVKIQTRDQFTFHKLEPAIGVEIAYNEGLEGRNVMVFRKEDVRIIVGILMGEEIPEEQFEMDELTTSAICEVMNQMMGASATALSEFLAKTVNISTPQSFIIRGEEAFKDEYFPADTPMVTVGFILEIEGKLKSEFLNIMPTALARTLLQPFADTMTNEAPEAEAPKEKEAGPASQPEAPAAAQEAPVQEALQEAPVQETPKEAPVQEAPAQEAPRPQAPVQEIPQPQAYIPAQPQGGYPPAAQMVYPPMADPYMAKVLEQMQQTQLQMMEFMRDMRGAEKKRPSEAPEIIRPHTSVSLSEGREKAGEEEAYANQEMLMQVPLEVSVEIGRTKKKVRDILEFTQGSLVVLDKMAGEQVDLLVNGRCIARGDIVVVEDNFGVRITEIVSKELEGEGLL